MGTGHGSVEVATTLSNLAVTRGVLGEYEKAAELLGRVLLVFENHYGANHENCTKVREAIDMFSRLTHPAGGFLWSVALRRFCLFLSIVSRLTELQRCCGASACPHALLWLVGVVSPSVSDSMFLELLVSYALLSTILRARYRDPPEFSARWHVSPLAFCHPAVLCASSFENMTCRCGLAFFFSQ